MKNKILLICFIVLGLGLTTFFWFSKDNSIVDAQMTDDIVKEEFEEVEKKESEDKIDSVFMVDIKGAIKKPGVYEVDSNKRVIDVIKLAGGLNSNANTNYINLSSKVKDEMVIWIYTKEEIEKMKLEQSSANYMIESCNCPVVDNTTCLNSNEENNNEDKKEIDKENDIININNASLEELMSLNGVGESKAKSIIDYRNRIGNFKSKEDIMNVSGIGEALYNKIKDSITV